MTALPGHPVDAPTRAELEADDPRCRCTRDTFGNVTVCGACEARAEADEWLDELEPDEDPSA
jgi:hypothetical protein